VGRKSAAVESAVEELEGGCGEREPRARAVAVRFRPGPDNTYVKVKREAPDGVDDAVAATPAPPAPSTPRTAFGVGDLVLISTAADSVRRTLANGRTEPFHLQAATKFVGPFEVLAGPGRAGRGYKLKIPRGKNAKLAPDSDVCDGDIGIEGDLFEAAALTMFRNAEEQEAVQMQRRQAKGRGSKSMGQHVCTVDFVLDRRMLKKNGKAKKPHALVAWQGGLIRRCL